MTEIFLYLANRSITAGCLILVVLALRLLLRKVPKNLLLWLWALVGLRLILPVPVESALSLIPKAKPIPMDIAYSPAPAIDSGIAVIDRAVNPVITENLTPVAAASVNPMQIVLAIVSVIWLVGVVVMLLYAAVSYYRLSRKCAVSMHLQGKLYLCDNIPTPFVLGVLRPRIYLPNTLSREDMPYVIAHERAHIRRRDPLWKALGFGLLCIYWFQPLLWLGYALFCRDMELACDEKVASSLSPSHRANYSQALLNCSAGRRFLAACPVAFGEVGVKERVKRVLSFRRPTLRAVLAAVLICAVIAVCFLTNPVTPEPPKVTVAQMSITAEDVTPTGMTLTYHPDNAFQDVDAVTDSIYWLEKQNDSGGWQAAQSVG